jgi:probable sporulation protein (polysaccharide deacetylase family)
MRTIGFILSISFVVMISQSSAISAYIASVKQKEAVPVFTAWDDGETMEQQIKQAAPSQYIKPIDARIDPIWKAVPGYNGREVDIEATVQKSLRLKSKQIVWVYREIQPNISLDELGPHPIYRGNEQKRVVALMVNVAWGTEHLPRMLAIFAKENIKATFFLDGSWVSKHPLEAKQIFQAGHEIGNHGYTHPLMSQISQERVVREISRTEDLIFQTLSIHSKWFAPPAGDYNQNVVNVAYQQHMRTILWTVDTVDWRKSSTPTVIVQRVEQRITPGSFILSHPTDRTVEALPQIIRVVKKKGLRFGTVSDVLSAKREDTVE